MKVKWSKLALAGITLLTAVLLFNSVLANAEQTNQVNAEQTNQANTVQQAEGSAVKTGMSEVPSSLMWLPPVAAAVAIIYVIAMIFYVLRKDPGNEKIQEISSYIREGASAYLKRQYSVVAIFFIVMFGILAAIAYGSDGKLLAKFVPYAFLTGGFFSGLSGFIGMKVATQANGRTTWAATKSLNSALRVAFSAGSVMGMAVVGLGLLDLSFWYFFLKWYFTSVNQIPEMMAIKKITETMLTFEMGASSMALFARVGGGIYTKSADVGADLVGKVEANIPEDDPRNPAVIADNVGDNVGDVAGMGADLYESYVGSIVATMALGAVAFSTMPLKGVIVPMSIAAIGVFSSLIGTFLVRTKEDATQKNLLRALRIGIYSASILIAVASYFLIRGALGAENIGVWWAMIIGLVVGNIIGYSTEYYTSSNYKPTVNLSDYANRGPATFVIGGIALGMESVWVPVSAVVLGIAGAYFTAGGGDPAKGLYGIGVAAIGMLSTLGITLSTDAYGPVADNAGGIAEMAGLDPEVRKRTDALDALGNTTAATGKGFAIGSAALTALALLAAYRDEVVRILQEHGIFKAGQEFVANLITPEVIIGLFLGAMMPFLFSSMAMKAVGRVASKMVDEVRRQFRELGILEGKGKPDYASCVKISTAGAQKEMILPALMAIIVPIVTGIFFGPMALAGLLAGALVAGFPLAVMMANAGGAWDNAKKYIEEGHHGGKGSDAHKAGVVGDTVGDPFKDTAGPSLNILLKLMSMTSVVFAAVMIALNRTVGIFGL